MTKIINSIKEERPDKEENNDKGYSIIKDVSDHLSSLALSDSDEDNATSDFNTTSEVLIRGPITRERHFQRAPYDVSPSRPFAEISRPSRDLGGVPDTQDLRPFLNADRIPTSHLLLNGGSPISDYSLPSPVTSIDESRSPESVVPTGQSDEDSIQSILKGLQQNQWEDNCLSPPWSEPNSSSKDDIFDLYEDYLNISNENQTLTAKDDALDPVNSQMSLSTFNQLGTSSFMLDQIDVSCPPVFDLISPLTQSLPQVDLNIQATTQSNTNKSTPFSFIDQASSVFNPLIQSDLNIQTMCTVWSNTRESMQVPVSPGSQTLVQANIPQVLPNSSDSFRYVPIQPRPAAVVIRADTAPSQEPRRRKVSGDPFLSIISTKEKGKFHKMMLSIAKKEGGFNRKNEEGLNYLHTMIWTGKEKFAIYFVYLLDLWLNGSKCSEYLQGVTSISDIMDCQDHNGKTPLVYCSMFNMPLLAGFLLSKDARWNLSDRLTGENPLHVAVQRGHSFLTLIETLCKSRKLDLEAKNSLGQTATHLAIKCHGYTHQDEIRNTEELIDNRRVVELLLRNGAKLRAQDNMRQTPIHLAVENQNFELLGILYDYANDWDKAIKLKNYKGRTALEEASLIQTEDRDTKNKIVSKLLVSLVSVAKLVQF